MNLYETSLFWVKNGYSVVPVSYYSKKPLASKLPRDEYGDPTWEIYQTRLPTEDELKVWFQSYLANIGLVIGWRNLVVIDFDVIDLFYYWYKQFPINTYMVKTGRGVHVYIRTDQPAKNYHSELLDIKAERGYVLIPPSIHPSGYQYQILNPSPILSVSCLSEILPDVFTPEPEKIGITNSKSEISNDPWNIAEFADDKPGSVVEVREKIDILSFFPDAEKSSGDGRWWVTLCPFHNDKRPSFWIDTKRQICGCRKCNIKDMDVINLYARLNHISNTEAIRILSRSI